jgi:hypothetical protein
MLAQILLSVLDPDSSVFLLWKGRKHVSVSQTGTELKLFSS